MCCFLFPYDKNLSFFTPTVAYMEPMSTFSPILDMMGSGSGDVDTEVEGKELMGPGH
jgi:hypothetical protein